MSERESPAVPPSRVGLWMIGAAGNVATTVAAGLAYLRAGGDTGGLLSATPALSGTPLVGFENIVVGGHDLAGRTPVATVDVLAGDGVVPAAAQRDAKAAAADLAADLRPGAVSIRPGGTGAAAEIERVRGDLEAFSTRHGLDRVVVVNLASSEAQMADPLPADDVAFGARLEAGGIPASVLYARAAIDLGLGYVNFTPSTGASIPALESLAVERGAVLAGRDGKTGETLVKAALAPMFAARNLRVLSWFGQNILGNRDGQTLTDPEVRASKTRSKGALLPAVLGYQPDAHIGIDYVPSLGDWKIAWDHVLFEGFLGTRMSMQIVWQGADSILAAPLVIDLVRFVDLALRRGQVGALGHLAAYFKDPIDCDTHALDEQVRMLMGHVTGESP